MVRAIEAGGAEGLWRLAFEKLRKKLDAEGLLAPERKRPLPRSPASVGVVTSTAGAALKDRWYDLQAWLTNFYAVWVKCRGPVPA